MVSADIFYDTAPLNRPAVHVISGLGRYLRSLFTPYPVDAIAIDPAQQVVVISEGRPAMAFRLTGEMRWLHTTPSSGKPAIGRDGAIYLIDKDRVSLRILSVGGSMIGRTSLPSPASTQPVVSPLGLVCIGAGKHLCIVAPSHELIVIALPVDTAITSVTPMPGDSILVTAGNRGICLSVSEQ